VRSERSPVRSTNEADFRIRCISFDYAERNKKIVLEVSPYFPSSKLCSTCGNSKSSLTLSEREWTCTYCNTTHDRDVNAARNLNLISFWYKFTGTTITTKSEYSNSITPYLRKVARF